MVHCGKVDSRGASNHNAHVGPRRRGGATLGMRNLRGTLCITCIGQWSFSLQDGPKSLLVLDTRFAPCSPVLHDAVCMLPPSGKVGCSAQTHLVRQDNLCPSFMCPRTLQPPLPHHHTTIGRRTAGWHYHESHPCCHVLAGIRGSSSTCLHASGWTDHSTALACCETEPIAAIEPQ